MKRKPRIGEKVYIKNIAQYAPPNGKPCKVTRSGLGLVWVKPLRWRGEDLEIDEDDIIFIEPEQFSAQERKNLVSRFVKEETLVDPLKFRMELSHIKRLIRLYPDLNFWRSYNPGYQMKSLLWWFGKGKDQFKIDYMSKTLDTVNSKPQNDTLSNEKIGEDVVVNKKPKSVLDL